MMKPTVDIYLKKEVVDDGVIKHAADILGKWAAKLPYSPIGVFLENTSFIKMIEHACFKLEIESQIVCRTIDEECCPDDGDECPNIPLTSDFDVWAQKYSAVLDFKEHEDFFDITETRERIVCDDCEGCGEVTCDQCDGTALDICGREFWQSGCGGGGKVKIKTRDRLPDGDWGPRWSEERVVGVEKCSECHGSGQIKCKKCKKGLVQCESCEGTKNLIKYNIVCQKESPIRGESVYLSTNLPSFRSSASNPTTKLLGEECFTQDEPAMIQSLNLPRGEEYDVLSKLFSDYCESNSDFQAALGGGKVFRQVLKVYICPISEYIYEHKGNQYSIYVNRKTEFVEDLCGPIAQESARLMKEAEEFAGSSEYLKAFIANQKSKALVTNSSLEISARKALVSTTELTSAGIEKVKGVFGKLFTTASPSDTPSLPDKEAETPRGLDRDPDRLEETGHEINPNRSKTATNEVLPEANRVDPPSLLERQAAQISTVGQDASPQDSPKVSPPSPKYECNIKSSIQTFFESRAPVKSNSFYALENIPQKKQQSARASFKLPDGEEICVLIDATVFGSVKQGLLITESGVYISNGLLAKSRGSHFVDWESVRSTQGGVMEGEYEFLVGGGVYFNLSASGEGGATAKLLVELFAHLRV